MKRIILAILLMMSAGTSFAAQGVFSGVMGEPWIETEISASDDFNRADSANLGANWATPTFSAATPIKITTNQARATTNGADNAAYRTGEIYGDDHCSKITLVNTTSKGPTVRMSDTVNTFYYIDNNLLYKKIAGTNTAISGSFGVSVSGDVMELCAKGTTLTVYRNSSLVSTVASQSDIPSGYPGLYITGSSFYYDNWEGRQAP